MIRKHGLSKSRLLNSRQCQRRLWLEKHKPEAADDDDLQRVFAAGHKVGDLARQLYGDGVLINPDNSDLSAALQLTQASLAKAVTAPLYEATFETDGVLVRADIVRPFGTKLELLEVKGSTSVKDQYLDDCAVQAHVMTHAAHAPGRITVVHLDNEFVYPGGGQYAGIFHEENVTEEVRARLKDVPRWIDDARATLSGEEPKLDIGPHCKSPYACPFQDHCAHPLTRYPVQTLPRGGKKVWKMRADGIRDIREIPAGTLTTTAHQRVYEACTTGIAVVGHDLAAQLQALPYPRCYIDFETLNPGIPHWAGTSPFEQMPFQWSCHRVDASGTVTHTEFLADGAILPAREFIETLLATVGTRGCVPVYSSFEGNILGALAKRFKDLAPQIKALKDRLYDLLPLMQKEYYHPDMMGSWSIKSLLPAVVPALSYKKLGEVQDGGAAQDAYAETLLPSTPAARRRALRADLLAYCKLDTQALMEVVKVLS